MTHERDLFRAIVISGAALTAGCATSTPAVDAATTNDAGGEDAMVADASTNEPVDAAMPVDAPEDDGFVAII